MKFATTANVAETMTDVSKTNITIVPRFAGRMRGSAASARPTRRRVRAHRITQLDEG
jgi:hypothetical protein